MRNNYFQFKQFKIQQEKTAMKVCTDACLFGAYLAEKHKAKNVLDIGAGTGLLSLMYAQKNPATHIDAVEIEDQAFAQATENIQTSPWSEYILLHHTGLQQYVPNHQYDLILSNPPFFNNDLKSEDHARNLAMHSTQLSLEDIVRFAEKHLTKNGKLALLLPFHRTEEIEKNAIKYGFLLSEKMSARQTPKHSFFRSILIFEKEKTSENLFEISIRDEANLYSKSFSDYLKDYYLFYSFDPLKIHQKIT